MESFPRITVESLMALVILERLSKLSNVYEKVEIFKITK